MKLFMPWNRRASVYDRASTAMGVSLVLVATGMAMFAAGGIAGWFLCGFGLLVGAVHPKCPRCGKSPMREALIARQSPSYHFWQAGRLWPEPVCSGCGQNLTTSRVERPDE